MFADIDSDGFKDLYVVSGGNSYSQNDSHYSDRLYFNDGNGKFSNSVIVNDANQSGSKVIAEDYDNDGDLDLFVGGRHVPHQYPMPASSKLLINENGQLVDRTDLLLPELKNFGMVSDAIWADYDNDGDSDLILVGERMPISVFRNDSGKFSKVSPKGLENS